MIRQTWSAEDTCAFVEFNIWCFSEIYIYIYIYCFIWNKLKYAAFHPRLVSFIDAHFQVETRGCGPELCTIRFLFGTRVLSENIMPHNGPCQYLTHIQMDMQPSHLRYCVALWNLGCKEHKPQLSLISTISLHWFSDRKVQYQSMSWVQFDPKGFLLIISVLPSSLGWHWI